MKKKCDFCLANYVTQDKITGKPKLTGGFNKLYFCIFTGKKVDKCILRDYVNKYIDFR